jgi:hypothetical protein
MENKRCAKLVLRATDLLTCIGTTAPQYNSFGVTNVAGKTSCTWTNIDMRALLGSLYDEYDFFNLQCVGVIQATNTDSTNTTGGTVSIVGTSTTNSSYTIGATSSDRTIWARMTGLPFVCQSYDIGSARNNNGSCIVTPPMILTSNATTSLNFANTGFVSTFRKIDKVDITIDILRLVDNSRPTLNASVGGANFANGDYNMIYTFNIYPVLLERRDQFDDARERQKLKI